MPPILMSFQVHVLKVTLHISGAGCICAGALANLKSRHRAVVFLLQGRFDHGGRTKNSREGCLVE